VWFKRKPKPDPTEATREMRDMALRVEPAELGLTPTPERPHVWGVLMETGYPDAVASLVALADGTTSLYFSNGGGIIGAGEYATVRDAAGAFLSSADAHAARFAPVTDTPLPAVTRVRFYVRSFGGLLGAEADEEALGRGRHPLSPVFHAGQAVITAMREATERRETNES
jgi:hypothetical protein